MSPYHDLQWSEGWSYGPPPSDPYKPSSGTQLGMFIVNGDANVHSQNYTGPIPSTADVNGMFGAGSSYADSAFWFDASSAYVGCGGDMNQGVGCLFEVFGWRYNATSGVSERQLNSSWGIPPCQHSAPCSLVQLNLDDFSDFTRLTALEMRATWVQDSVVQSIYVDDIALSWSNNSCAAIQARDNLFSISVPHR